MIAHDTTIDRHEAPDGVAARARRATYLLPIRVSSPDDGELTDYLRRVAEWLPLVIVDGSPDDVFAVHQQRWSAFAHHLRPDPDLACANGKVQGVMTGLRRVATEVVVLADDDVRYAPAQLELCIDALDDADLVCPQNYFDPLPWHARWDTARTLVHRAFGVDHPGTLVVRTAMLQRTDGYDGDVLFENLELMRTVRAAGGTCVHRADIYVRRTPPRATHFIGQRVRQAYDEFARPAHLAAALTIVPVALWLGRRRRIAALAGGAACSVVLAERGRRVAGGRAYFPASASMLAPMWLLERGVCSWLAVWHRARGGVPYAGRRILRAANAERAIAARLRAARSAPVARSRLGVSGGHPGERSPAD